MLCFAIEESKFAQGNRLHISAISMALNLFQRDGIVEEQPLLGRVSTPDFHVKLGRLLHDPTKIQPTDIIFRFL
jgi:hypothetical protein